MLRVITEYRAVQGYLRSCIKTTKNWSKISLQYCFYIVSINDEVEWVNTTHVSYYSKKLLNYTLNHLLDILIYHMDGSI